MFAYQITELVEWESDDTQLLFISEEKIDAKLLVAEFQEEQGYELVYRTDFIKFLEKKGIVALESQKVTFEHGYLHSVTDAEDIYADWYSANEA